MRLGVGTFTYTWAIGVPGHPPAAPMTPLELGRRAAALGIRVVQFADNCPLTRLNRQELDELQAFTSEHHMAVELGTRGIHSGDLPGHLALAQRFNAPFVRLVLDAPGHEPTPAECLRDLRPHVESFAAAGVQLALENHDRFSAATLAQLVIDLGCDHVGITLDTVNSLGALEGPEVVVRTLGPFVVNLHLKDFTIRRVPSQMGFVVEGCPAGAGRLDISWLLAELRRLNSRADQLSAIIELWTPHAPTLAETIARENAWAEESVQRLRRFIPD